MPTLTPVFILIGALSIVALLQLVLHLGLYLGMRQELSALRKENAAEVDYLRSECERMNAELASLSGDVSTLKPAPAAQAKPGQTINLSRRNQILRMYARGESPEAIAKTLQVTKGEVDLLLKVHRTLTDSIRAAAAASGQ